ncbi:MAG: hypothetical protein WKF72_09345 [Nocardioidaceae bacterium]
MSYYQIGVKLDDGQRREVSAMRRGSYAGRPATCPSWCAIRHGVVKGEDNNVHVSGALLVRRTVLRLCATIDPETGAVDGPHVLVGSEEYSLHEADALIDALTQLVDEGAEVTPRVAG